VPAVLLHGFAGTARHWDRVLAFGLDAVTPTLNDADPMTPDGVTSLTAAAAPGRFTLVGYSMGGRLALHVALALPERVERLVLVSASAGIEDGVERERRREADEALAREIERHDIAWFVERWRAVPLFARDPPAVVDEVARDERRCTPAALAACLRAFGPSAMAPVWDRVGELAMPVTVLAGERDGQYVATGQRLVAAIPTAELRIVPDAGHRLALEAPEAIAGAIA
jgi:2-succinyl-6-hydroxy-2,4-cyclohexadiene-1-carboxylate synthase